MAWTSALFFAAVLAQPQSEPEPKKPEDKGRQKVSITALAASGVTLVPGHPKSQLMRSAATLLFDVGFFHPEHTWLEFSPAMMVEFERGQLFGLGFRLRAFTSLWRLRVYAIGGIEAFLAPYKRLGARMGAGVVIPLHHRVGIAAEFGPTVYFAGDDLQKNTTGTKLDAGLGLRVNF